VKAIDEKVPTSRIVPLASSVEAWTRPMTSEPDTSSSASPLRLVIRVPSGKCSLAASEATWITGSVTGDPKLSVYALPLSALKLIASLLASDGVKSARSKTVDVPSVTLVAGPESTFVADSETVVPCNVPLAVAGLPPTDVQSAKSEAVSAAAPPAGGARPAAPPRRRATRAGSAARHGGRRRRCAALALAWFDERTVGAGTARVISAIADSLLRPGSERRRLRPRGAQRE
jgi:hypothetical protein